MIRVTRNGRLSWPLVENKASTCGGGKILIAMAIIFVLGCNHNANLEFVRKNAIALTPKRVPFALLMNSISDYDTQYIETEGIFYHSLEEQSLNMLRLKNDSGIGSLWLNFEYSSDNSLVEINSGKRIFSEGMLVKLNGRMIKVRGTINIFKNGHLGQYIASIEQITYIKTQ